jgi:preprotein translocase subunit SecE
VANDKEQNKAVAIQDTKNLRPAAKAKKTQVQVTQPKKRRFSFFTDVIGELRKVVWPTRQETIRLTAIVIGICLFMALLLGSLDYAFSEFVAKVLLGGH